MRPDFHGIYPMLYAFFGRDGALDRGAMRRQVEGCIAAGVHGLAVGGLASECNKLATAERRRMLEWVLEDAKGRVPVSVTIAENSIAGQGEMAQAAAQAGARWVVLQPPPVRGASEAELIRFYGAVAEKCALPVGIQNAPEYIGIGVSNAGFAELNRRHPNVSIVKAEGPATYIDALARDTGGVFCLFNGRNGVELVDSLRAGCQGLIPGVESCDAQARIFDLFRKGEEAQADREYAELLPLLHFLMQGIDHLLCYGKRLAARRLGLGEVFDRAPAVQPTAFGLAVAERWSRALPALPG
jgi:2-keto-3-deoxy-L-arabinonate dehydratase